jgi:dTDP-4-dehydrorhamnose 3,5-epimerase
MNVIATVIPGVIVLGPKVFGDDRGYFLETWSRQKYEAVGIPAEFVQDNVSFSRKGVLRGLHYQHPQSQGKLVQVMTGEVFDVALDIRVGSPTFGKAVGEILSEKNHRQMYIPPGFAHGFCVLSDTVLFSYKCTDYYHAAAEGGICWNDPDLVIDWPIREPNLSPKDGLYPRLRDVPRDRLPIFGAGR